MALLIVTEASLFAFLLFSHFYLGARAPGAWPPSGAPSLRIALPNTAILLASSAALDWAERRLTQRRPPWRAVGTRGHDLAGRHLPGTPGGRIQSTSDSPPTMPMPPAPRSLLSPACMALTYSWGLLFLGFRSRHGLAGRKVDEGGPPFLLERGAVLALRGRGVDRRLHIAVPGAEAWSCDRRDLSGRARHGSRLVRGGRAGRCGAAPGGGAAWRSGGWGAARPRSCC